MWRGHSLKGLPVLPSRRQQADDKGAVSGDSRGGAWLHSGLVSAVQWMSWCWCWWCWSSQGSCAIPSGMVLEGMPEGRRTGCSPMMGGRRVATAVFTAMAVVFWSAQPACSPGCRTPVTLQPCNPATLSPYRLPRPPAGRQKGSRGCSWYIQVIRGTYPQYNPATKFCPSKTSSLQRQSHTGNCDSSVQTHLEGDHIHRPALLYEVQPLDPLRILNYFSETTGPTWRPSISRKKSLRPSRGGGRSRRSRRRCATHPHHNASSEAITSTRLTILLLYRSDCLRAERTTHSTTGPPSRPVFRMCPCAPNFQLNSP